MFEEPIGPQHPFAEQLHAEKYRGEGESFRESVNRVASALSDSPQHFQEFRQLLMHQAFLPAGRIQSAVGSTRDTTPYNCYVSGRIEDSFVEGKNSIMAMATEAAATMRKGGGIGYDFSTLRPKGSLIKKLQSTTDGPLAFMGIFDAICKCVASSGHRRGAQMGVLRVDHPDIEDFIRAKQNQDRLTGFNISVAVTDEFMRAVRDGTKFALRWGGEVHREIDARTLWETMMRSTWDWAEPGVLFIDRINEMNNLAYCENICATNPCGEQPLPPYGACLLGSFNLVKFIRRISKAEAALRQIPGLRFDECTGLSVNWHFDMERFAKAIPPVVRAMDNVVDRANYPLYEQEREAKDKRRMGLGLTGVANALEAMGRPYGSERFCNFLEAILIRLNLEAYRASCVIAKEKGPFPKFDHHGYTQSMFFQRLVEADPGLGTLLAENGIRNSHLTSIAPTGTISMVADNVSSGIEPVFAYSVERQYRGPDGMETVELQDYGFSVLGVEGRTAAHITVDEHLRVLTTATRWVDSAVSKTCNVPPDTPWADFKRIYMRAWENGCKGITTFQTNGKRFGILKSKDEEAAEEAVGSACKVDLETGRRECE